GYLFSNSQPRSFLTFTHCQNRCLNKNELLGLVASAGIQKTPHLLPKIVAESDKTLVIQAPDKQPPIHLIAIPKKDIRDISELNAEDKEYLTDVYAILGKIVREKKLTNYRIVTNGIGYQDKTYLHFHLLAE
ncbi:MAG: HIT domain-containing protein, partial [Candidatus Roizmanbacteria bacterium]